MTAALRRLARPPEYRLLEFCRRVGHGLWLPLPKWCYSDRSFSPPTTAAGAGGLVGTLVEVTGLYGHLAAWTDTHRPTLTQDASGKWYLAPDGSDYMYTVYPSAPSSGECWVALKMSANDSGAGYVQNTTDVNASHYSWIDGNVYDNFGSSTRISYARGGYDLSAVHLAGRYAGGGVKDSFYNDVNVSSTLAATAFGTTVWTLAGDGGGTYVMASGGRWYGMTFGAALTDEQRSELRKRLGEFAGLSL